MNRRNILAGGAAAFSLTAFPSLLAASLRPATPAAAEGPFYPDRLPLDRDSDLVSVRGRSGTAKGTVFHLGGTVTDTSGTTLDGTRLEIWQCDANGVYLHSADSGNANFDPNFQGFGRTISSENGLYRFRTILPVPYTGRTPHIHFRIIAPNGRTLTTQMYLADDPRNRRDFLYRRLDGPDARKSVSVVVSKAPEVEKGAVKGRFDIVLG
ncbi:MAG: intradiol ring-cleavage dioxygenase [Alphaproteobacteria bacterium]